MELVLSLYNIIIFFGNDEQPIRDITIKIFQIFLENVDVCNMIFYKITFFTCYSY